MTGTIYNGADLRVYNTEDMYRLLGKREAMMQFVRVDAEHGAAVATFSVPERKRFTAITEWQYFDSCNELAMLLFGVMTEGSHPAVAPYIRPEEFIPARNENRLHAKRTNVAMTKLRKPDETFDIEMALKMAKPVGNMLYVGFRIGDAVKGYKSFFYTPRPEQLEN